MRAGTQSSTRYRLVKTEMRKKALLYASMADYCENKIRKTKEKVGRRSVFDGVLWKIVVTRRMEKNGVRILSSSKENKKKKVHINNIRSIQHI